MTLATHGDDGPWAAAVFYATTAARSTSCRRRRRATPITWRATPLMRRRSSPTSPSGRGSGRSSSRGRVRELSGDDARLAHERYDRKFPLVADLASAPRAIAPRLCQVRWSVTEADRLRFIDNRRGFGPRDRRTRPRHDAPVRRSSRRDGALRRVRQRPAGVAAVAPDAALVGRVPRRPPAARRERLARDRDGHARLRRLRAAAVCAVDRGLGRDATALADALGLARSPSSATTPARRSRSNWRPPAGLRVTAAVLGGAVHRRGFGGPSRGPPPIDRAERRADGAHLVAPVAAPALVSAG